MSKGLVVIYFLTQYSWNTTKVDVTRHLINQSTSSNQNTINWKPYSNYSRLLLPEKVEDTKGIIRSKSKDKQRNG